MPGGREQLDGVFAGVARKGHPVLEALTDIVARHRLDRAPFEALIEAHIGRVHGEPHDLDAFYVGPMQVAATLLAGSGHETEPSSRPGGCGAWPRPVGSNDALSLRAPANRALARLPAAAFPAVAHAALHRTGESEPMKRLRLTWAVLRGRL